MEISRGMFDMKAIHDNSMTQDMLDKFHDDLNRLMRDHGQIDLIGIQKEDERENRKILQTIVKNEVDMNDFKTALWDLYQKKEGLPLIDCTACALPSPLQTIYSFPVTGQITLTSQEPVLTGSSNKIFQGACQSMTKGRG